MHFSIRDRDRLLDDSTRELAERRFQFALSRFGSRISKVGLVVEDENGPRGGIDKSIRASVRIKGGSDLVLTDRDDDWGRCLSRIAERTGRAVARAIDKTQRFDRIPATPAGITSDI